MKKEYVKPKILVHNVSILNSIVCMSQSSAKYRIEIEHNDNTDDIWHNEPNIFDK